MRFLKLYVIFTLLLFMLHLPITITVHAEKLPAEMKVHFINVGQGDSIFIETPGGKHILIDGGRPEYGKKVATYLKEQKVDELDLMIATHPDYDHIGGLIEVLKKFEVKQIIDSGKLHNTKTYGRYLNEIRKQDTLFNIAVEDDSIDIDPDLSIKILNTHAKGKNNNQSSIVLKIIYKDISFLLMGDTEHEQEKKLMEKYDLKADIIKVAHHGSKTSSSMNFLKEVNPKVALLTYQKQNHFGHPVDRVITNLNQLDTHIYSTAVFGDIVIRTNGADYYIFPEKTPGEGILEKTG